VRVGAELGRVSAAVRVRARYRVPQSLAPDRRRRSARSASLPAEIELRLWAGVDRVDVRVALENRARDHRLRLHLGAPFRAERFQVESAFELADRPLEAEEPGAEGRLPAERPIGTVPERSFAAIAGGGAAVTVANRGLAEVEAVARPDGRSELAVTLLRAVGWLSRDDLVLRPAHAGPPLETPGAQVPGPHRGELSIRWHAQDAPGRSAEAHRFAYPPLCLQRGRPAPGEAPVVADGAQLLATDDPELVVSAIEPRPEGRALVRVYNASPEARRARLVWGGPGRASLEAVDLAERPAGGVVAGEGEDGVEIALRPWQIASLRTR
jgi:mannosylglycerate hydrolase